MTEQLTDPTEAYGMQIGRELRALSDRAIQPYDPATIAHAVTVRRPARLGRRIEMRLEWLRGTRPLLVAVLLLVSALLLALWVGATHRPSPPITFELGSIAFSRDGDLFVIAPDGSQPVLVADGDPSSSAITKFAFSPDLRQLAFVRTSDAATGAETLEIASPGGALADIYTGPGDPNRSASSAGLFFGWSPDGRRLAVFPGATDTQIEIIDTDGNPVRALDLPSGVAMTTTDWSFFGSLAWSPDSSWVAAAVQLPGALSNCPTVSGNPAVSSEVDTCYVLLATDGAGARGTSDELSNYLAWAPDSRLALTHWYTKTVEIRALDGSTPQIVVLPGTTPRRPLTETNDGHVLAWSPDGTLLLVAGYDKWAQRNTLVVIQGDGTARSVPLDDTFNGVVDPSTGLGMFVDAVAWSIDGKQLLFQGAKSGSASSGIWSVDVDGKSPTLVVETTGPIFDVADGHPW